MMLLLFLFGKDCLIWHPLEFLVHGCFMQGSFDYPCCKDKTLQIHGNFGHLVQIHEIWVGDISWPSHAPPSSSICQNARSRRLDSMDDFNLSYLGVAKPSGWFFGNGGLRWLGFNMTLCWEGLEISSTSTLSWMPVCPDFFAFLGGPIDKLCTWNPLMTFIFEETRPPKTKPSQWKQWSMYILFSIC